MSISRRHCWLWENFPFVFGSICFSFLLFSVLLFIVLSCFLFFPFSLAFFFYCCFLDIVSIFILILFMSFFSWDFFHLNFVFDALVVRAALALEDGDLFFFILLPSLLFICFYFLKGLEVLMVRVYLSPTETLQKKWKRFLATIETFPLHSYSNFLSIFFSHSPSSFPLSACVCLSDLLL